MSGGVGNQRSVHDAALTLDLTAVGGHEPVYDMSMQPVPYMVASMVQWCTIVRHKGH